MEQGTETQTQESETQGLGDGSPWTPSQTQTFLLCTITDSGMNREDN